MDEMTVFPGEGNGQANGDARAITRDPVGWRAAVFGRLGTTVRTSTRIEQHQLQELAYLKKQISHLRREVKACMFVRKVPTETTVVTQRGTVIEEGVPPVRKSATLSGRPKFLSQLWTEWMKGINGRSSSK